MSNRGCRGWWLVFLVEIAAGCGQELSFPMQGPKEEAALPGADAPSDGITGAAGMRDGTPPARLPLPNESAFAGEGGAAGEGGMAGDADHDPPAHGSSGGSRGDDSPRSGAAGKGTGSGGSAPVAGGSAGSGKGGSEPASGGAAGEGGDAGATTGARDLPSLFFSEYVEGSGSVKALEIYASAAASLEGCELWTYFNGKPDPARLALHGELPAEGFQVLCSSTLAAAQPSLCSRTTSLTFNGDDALALACDGVVLDVFGEPGIDPGDSWGTGATVDHTLRRRCSVTRGRKADEPFDIDAEWITFGADTLSDLGRRVCTP